MAPDVMAGTQLYSNWLADRRAALQAELRAGAHSEAAWSWGRLLAFLLAAVIWYPFKSSPPIAAGAVGAALLLFGATVFWHGRMARQRMFLRAQLTVVDESGRRVGGQAQVVRWGSRPAQVTFEGGSLPPLLSGGRTWLLTEQERDDLDLYATPLGIFGLLNRTSTHLGACRLCDDLENLRLEPAKILARQSAVRWLAERHEARQRLLAALSGLRHFDDSLTAFAHATADAQIVMSIPVAWIARLWSAAGSGLLLLAMIGMVTGQMRLAVIGAVLMMVAVIVNSAVLFPLWRRMRHSLARWELAKDFAEGYLAVARHAARELCDGPDPSGEELDALRPIFAAVMQPAALPGALRWMHWAAGGGLMQMVLNRVGLYQLHMWERIHRHVVPLRDAMRAGMSALVELESILSLACFAAEQPGVTWPVLTEGTELMIQAATHPMIPPAGAVANDAAIGAGKNVWLITGSNMSGKSTFLRTIGVNVLLAQAGCAVCCRSMQLKPMRLMTDLRIRDNLGRGESYFLAEVRQVRRMILPPEDAAPVLGLVDEPFRGTNHQEQRAATMAIVEHLAKTQGLFLIATHDRTVAAIANGLAENFHFQEELGEKELVFDYRLRPGPADSRNALRVLEREGYPAELVARANQWAVGGNDQ